LTSKPDQEERNEGTYRAAGSFVPKDILNASLCLEGRSYQLVHLHAHPRVAPDFVDTSLDRFLVMDFMKNLLRHGVWGAVKFLGVFCCVRWMRMPAYFNDQGDRAISDSIGFGVRELLLVRVQEAVTWLSVDSSRIPC